MARIAIITGAASGVGRALASALVARGDTVVVADVDGDGAERAAGGLARHGPGVGVTAVCPGFVDTPILDKGGPDDLPKPANGEHWREMARHFQPRLYRADRLAQDILRGIDRNAALVIAPASARVAWRLWRYAPVVVNRMAARQLVWTRATFPTGLPGLVDAGPAQVPVPRKGGGRDD